MYICDALFFFLHKKVIRELFHYFHTIELEKKLHTLIRETPGLYSILSMSFWLFPCLLLLCLFNLWLLLYFKHFLSNPSPLICILSSYFTTNPVNLTICYDLSLVFTHVGLQESCKSLSGLSLASWMYLWLMPFLPALWVLLDDSLF